MTPKSQEGMFLRRPSLHLPFNLQASQTPKSQEIMFLRRQLLPHALQTKQLSTPKSQEIMSLRRPPLPQRHSIVKQSRPSLRSEEEKKTFITSIRYAVSAVPAVS